jgi:hypothetical protein
VTTDHSEPTAQPATADYLEDVIGALDSFENAVVKYVNALSGIDGTLGPERALSKRNVTRRALIDTIEMACDAIAQERDAAREQAKALREALEDFGQHSATCAWGEHSCACGLSDAKCQYDAKESA